PAMDCSAWRKVGIESIILDDFRTAIPDHELPPIISPHTPQAFTISTYSTPFIQPLVSATFPGVIPQGYPTKGNCALDSIDFSSRSKLRTMCNASNSAATTA